MIDANIFFIVRDSAAFDVIKRLCEAPVKSGRVILCSKEELDSLRTHMLAVRVEGLNDD